MDSSRRRKSKNVDGFVSAKMNSPQSNPFEKINKAKLDSSPGMIPHRKSISYRNLNENFISNRKNDLNLDPRTSTVSPNMVSSGPTLAQGLPEKKISRREKRRVDQLERLHKKTKLKKVFKSLAIFIVAVIIIIGGYLGFKFFHNIDKVFGGNIVSNISSLFSSTTLKGEASGRINILLAGDSADQLNHGGAQLTDSILIISINTKNNTAFMLSIPRDLWVNIPGMGWEKINSANDNTGTYFAGYPQNGMGILEHVVTADLGIPIDYYAISDYGAFSSAVNAVGGVTVNIQSPDPRGLYDPNTNLKLPNGPATLDGQEALNLARARGDGYGSYGFPSSDFDRTQHQRQIFTAVAAKAKTVGVLADPLKIGNLFDTLGNNIQTDLNLKDVLQLVKISKNFNLSNIQSFAFCSTLTLGLNGCNNAILTDYTDPASGQEAIIPVAGVGNYTQVQQYYNQLVSSNPLARENANIVISNGSNTSGIASAYQTKINNAGGNVTAVSDASTVYSKTEIVDNSSGSFPATLSYLETLFGKNVVKSNSTLNPAGADFVVIIGNNQKLPSAN
ncbi:MAG TPA: LCP family protein [Candidatus Saccharimonadales bacterium]